MLQKKKKRVSLGIPDFNSKAYTLVAFQVFFLGKRFNLEADWNPPVETKSVVTMELQML